VGIGGLCKKKSLIMRYNLKNDMWDRCVIFRKSSQWKWILYVLWCNVMYKTSRYTKFVRRPVWFISKQWPNDTTINPSHAKFFCTSENGNYGGMLVTLAHGPCWQKLRTGVVCQFNYLRMFLVLLPSYILPYFY